MLKKCSKCATEKQPEEFSSNPKAKDGKYSICKVCVRVRHKAWRERPENKLRLQTRNKLWAREFRKTNPEKCKEWYWRVNKSLSGHMNTLLSSCRRRATLTGCPFDIDKAHLLYLYEKQQGICAISGIEMTITKQVGRVATNISVDRIEAHRGYTKDNIRLVCLRANEMKSEGTDQELLAWCLAVVKHKGKYPEGFKVA